MLINQLFEDANLDISMSHDIDELRNKMYSYLYKRKDDPSFRMTTAVYKGKEQDALMVRDVDPDSVFADVILIFNYVDGYGIGGVMSPRDIPAYNIKYLVALDAIDKGVAGALKTLWVDRSAATFRHEFVHVLDFKRRKESQDKIKSTTPKDDSDLEKARYANNPLERNAFFHNLAEPLLNRLRFIHKGGKDTLGLFNPIENDFNGWLKKETSKSLGSTKRWWDHLSPDNKRKAIARIYKLFIEVQNAQREVEAFTP